MGEGDDIPLRSRKMCESSISLSRASLETIKDLKNRVIIYSGKTDLWSISDTAVLDLSLVPFPFVSKNMFKFCSFGGCLPFLDHAVLSCSMLKPL